MIAVAWATTTLLERALRVQVSQSANPAPKLATLIAGMCAGADSIDDIDMLRSGDMKTLFHGVYTPSTIGTLLREFSFGHARQLESVLRDHLRHLCRQVDLLPGASEYSSVSTHYCARSTDTPSLKPAPAGRLRGANPHLLRSTASRNSSYIKLPSTFVTHVDRGLIRSSQPRPSTVPDAGRYSQPIQPA
jgi:hypothetical protein